MKKLLIGIAIILIASVYAFRDKDDQQKANIAKLLPTPSVCDKCTLDGIPYVSADSMVRAFIDPNNEPSYDHKLHTCVWYSADTFKAMCKALSNDDDGVRFYFAKKGGQYSAIAVPTKLDYSSSLKKWYHSDHFLSHGLEITTHETYVFARATDNTPDRGARLYDTIQPIVVSSDCGETSNHFIKYSKAYRMVYKNCGKGSKQGKFNATSEWFDKCFLKQMADSIPEGGGIRFYYAKNNGSIFKNGRLFPKGRHGFVLMLTEAEPTGKNFQQDKFICLPKPNCLSIVSKIKNGLPLRINGFLQIEDSLQINDSGDGATDNGEECPTNCIGVTWSDPVQ